MLKGSMKQMVRLKSASSIQKSRMAVTVLTMAFRDNDNQYCMNMVFNSKTADWPSNQTWEIIQELQDEYAPTNLMGDAE